jgi:hypothetical protein
MFVIVLNYKVSILFCAPYMLINNSANDIYSFSIQSENIMIKSIMHSLKLIIFLLYMIYKIIHSGKFPISRLT